VPEANTGQSIADKGGLSIVVLLKQVPDIQKVKFDTERGKLDRSSAPAEPNPFDLNALEAGVRLKEESGGRVTVISMGPPQAESALRDALSRGADRAILLTDERFAGADTLATSYTLASAVKKVGKFDLIICGEKTIDGDTGQVGPEVAELLGIPHVAYVSKIKEWRKGAVVVVSDLGENYYVTELELPGLITVTKDVNEPRLPSLRDKLRARKSKIEIWNADDLADVASKDRFGARGSATQVYRITFPSVEGRRGKVLRGQPDEIARELAEELEKVLRGEKWAE
jgi:electron transfer flavoprotein beta subunit